MRIAIAERNQLSSSQIKELINNQFPIDILGTTEDELLSKITTHHIDVLFINILNISESITAAMQEHIPFIIITSHTASTEIAKQAIELGAKAYFPAPYDKEELTRILSKATHTLANYKKSTTYKRKTKIITNLSAVGGTGKSVITANLGLYLQKELKQKILILDAVPYYGMIDILLDCHQEAALTTIPDNISSDPDNWKDIESALIKHSSGLEILSAGDQRWSSSACKKLNTILSLVKDQGRYDFILVDTENTINEVHVLLLELSEQVLFFNTVDIPAFKAIHTALEVIKSLYFSLEKVKLIINRTHPDDLFTIEEMEKRTGLKTSVAIYETENDEIRTCINNGKPYIFEKPQLDISLKTKQLAESFVRNEQIKTIPKKNFLQALFGK